MNSNKAIVSVLACFSVLCPAEIQAEDCDCEDFVLPEDFEVCDVTELSEMTKVFYNNITAILDRTEVCSECINVEDYDSSLDCLDEYRCGIDFYNEINSNIYLFNDLLDGYWDLGEEDCYVLDPALLSVVEGQTELTRVHYEPGNLAIMWTEELQRFRLKGLFRWLFLNLRLLARGSVNDCR